MGPRGSSRRLDKLVPLAIEFLTIRFVYANCIGFGLGPRGRIHKPKPIDIN